ncbi:MAG: hypothetical protein HRT72_05555 [Flavobacteriales bacterium]|nr:hypothetical protein [Flavobacteriales bacterium]
MHYINKSIIKSVLLTATCILSFTVESWAQHGYIMKGDIDVLKRSKLYVVLDEGDSEYNKAIKQAVDKHWTLTKFDYITVGQFDSYRKKSKTSFLVVLMDQYVNEYNKKAQLGPQLTLLLGENQPNITDYRKKLSTIMIPGKFAKLKANEYNDLKLSVYPLTQDARNEIGYLMDSYVKMMINYVDMASANKGKLNPMKAVSLYNQNATKIQGKTLFVLKDDMEQSLQNMDRIKEVYNFGIKIVPQMAIEQSILSQSATVAFLYRMFYKSKSGMQRSYKIIIEAQGGSILYMKEDAYDHPINSFFNERDFKNISKN